MPHDYMPKRNADFLEWSRSFSQQINAAPTQFGLTPLQTSEYAALHAAFADAYHTAATPSTRTPPSIEAKRQARRAAERVARLLVRIIQATPTVTNAQKVGLALTVRDRSQMLVARPTESPRLFTKLLHGSTVRITLLGVNTTSRSKPEGVAGAMVFSYVGDVPPGDFSQWDQMATTNPRLTMTFNDVVPGAKVWLAAAWFNPRMERGPACAPKSLHVACQTLLLADAEQHQAA